MNIVLLGYWIAACCSPSRPIGRDYEDRKKKQLTAITRKAPHPMTMRRLALQASLALDYKRRWKRALHHAASAPTRGGEDEPVD